MWWNPTHDSFMSVESSFIPITGLGKLRRNKFVEISLDVKALLTRVEIYMCTTPSVRIPPVLGPLVQMMKHSLAQLDCIAMKFGQIEFQVRDVQQLWLEIVGILDYMEIYQPQMDASQGSIFVLELPAAGTIGTFTSDICVAQDHFHAGLPCWLFRPASAFTDQNILEVCKIEDTQSIDLHPRRFQSHVLAECQAGTDAKYNTIHAYTCNFMKYPDLFNLGTSITSTSSMTASSAAPTSSSAIIPQASSSTAGPIRTPHDKDCQGRSGNRNKSNWG
jgi:hypothetical protein